jgi:hypothetical protein
MLTYLELIVGIILIAYALLSYTGSGVLASVPILVRKGDVLWLAGIVLLGIAGILGWVGNILQTDLRLWRIIIAIIGVVLAIAAWVVRPSRPTTTP